MLANGRKLKGLNIVNVSRNGMLLNSESSYPRIQIGDKMTVQTEMDGQELTMEGVIIRIGNGNQA